MKFQFLRPSMTVPLLVLVVAFATAGYAANAIGSTAVIHDSIPSEDVTKVEVKTNAGTNLPIAGGKLAANSVGAADVAPTLPPSANILGVSVSGLVSLGGVPSGRCTEITLNVSGAQPGQLAWLVTKGPLQNGIVLYAAQRVKVSNRVEAVICNFSGTGMIPIVDLPVRVTTSTEVVNTIVEE